MGEVTRIYYRSPLQTEKSQPKDYFGNEAYRVFGIILAISINPRVGIFRSASETDD